MARQFKKVESQEEHHFDIYEKSEVGSSRIGDVTLLYLNNKLLTMKISLHFGNNAEIHLTSYEDLKNFKNIAVEIENIFSVSGLNSFQK